MHLQITINNRIGPNAHPAGPDRMKDRLSRLSHPPVNLLIRLYSVTR